MLIGVAGARIGDGYVIGTAGGGTMGCLRAVRHTSGIVIGNISAEAMLIGVAAALVSDGNVIGTAGVGAMGCLCAVCHAGGIVVGGIFPQLMPQGGVQQLCGDFRAAAAQVSDRGVIEAGCLGAGFQGHARVGMGTAAVIVQQLFGGSGSLIRFGIIVGNETVGQVGSIGVDFTVSIITAADVGRI